MMERQKSSTERASSTGSAQCLLFSRRRSYIPAAVPVSIMSSDVFVQQLFPGFPADTTVKTAAVPEVVRRRSRQPQPPAPQDLHEPRVTAADRQPGSDMFWKTGPAAACMADYPEHIAPKSPQEHRSGSAIPSERIIN